MCRAGAISVAPTSLASRPPAGRRSALLVRAVAAMSAPTAAKPEAAAPYSSLSVGEGTWGHLSRACCRPGDWMVPSSVRERQALLHHGDLDAQP